MKKIIIIITVLVLIALVVLAFTQSKKQSPDTTTTPALTDQQQAEDVVTAFGLHLKNVPLTAEPELLISSIQKEYAPFVTAALLDTWVSDLSNVPGRETSSPWPERIEIKSIEKVDDSYEVSAEVVMMTSVEVASNMGDAGRQAVNLTITEMNGEWRIANYQVTQ